MRTILIYIMCSFSAQICSSQIVEVLRTVETTKLSSSDYFDFIDVKTDSLQYSNIASYKCVGKNDSASLDLVFFKIANKAKYDGANSFKINSYSQNDSLNEITLILDTYLCNDSIREINLNNLEKNCIYVFSNHGPKKHNSVTFKINNDLKELLPGTYYKYVAKQGEKVKVSKGGITGMKAFYQFKETRQDIFLSLTGFGFNGIGLLPNNTVGVLFTTGQIHSLDLGLGYLLKTLLKESK